MMEQPARKAQPGFRAQRAIMAPQALPAQQEALQNLLIFMH
jgi:hypothetical protein